MVPSRGTLKSTYVWHDQCLKHLFMVGQAYSDQDSFVLEIAVSNGELVRERHDGQE